MDKMTRKKLSKTAGEPEDQPTHVQISKGTRSKIRMLSAKTGYPSHQILAFLVEHGEEEFLRVHGEQLGLD